MRYSSLSSSRCKQKSQKHNERRARLRLPKTTVESGARRIRFALRITQPHWLRKDDLADKDLRLFDEQDDDSSGVVCNSVHNPPNAFEKAGKTVSDHNRAAFPCKPDSLPSTSNVQTDAKRLLRPKPS